MNWSEWWARVLLSSLRSEEHPVDATGKKNTHTQHTQHEVRRNGNIHHTLFGNRHKKTPSKSSYTQARERSTRRHIVLALHVHSHIRIKEPNHIARFNPHGPRKHQTFKRKTKRKHTPPHTDVLPSTRALHAQGRKKKR